MPGCHGEALPGRPASGCLSSFPALKKGRFWITPDPYHKDDNIQIGREVKISCQVEAVPSEELTFSWFKNGRPLRSSERMVITQTDPDVSPGTTNLDIIDLKFTDFGTYTCVASLKGGGISDISIDVNISSSTVPPNLTVPQEKSPLVTREGDTIELQCQVTGKPKPIILWSRADKEVPMPDGSMQMESYDGILRIVNVSREMTGTYRCQTSQYNGFNVKPREALVQLIVQCKSPPLPPPGILAGGPRGLCRASRVGWWGWGHLSGAGSGASSQRRGTPSQPPCAGWTVASALWGKGTAGLSHPGRPWLRLPRGGTLARGRPGQPVPRVQSWQVLWLSRGRVGSVSLCWH
ncbi:MAM domain-containing glycosylphosphatidylinositol anchor protein 2 [Varanus komodoensis]|nr:MAM domain-containing glycosylphosphatidylinositol anchor protein 2 [Varanus komodoensis]